MIIACHQPNFFPWLPFFKKMERADIFVVMQNVQYSRNQFQNRFKYQGSWKTLSVNTGKLSDKIYSKKYLAPQEDWIKIKNSIRHDWLNIFDLYMQESLAQTNFSIINEITKIMGIQTLLVIDDLNMTSTATHRLIDICKKYEASTYLSGPSGRFYLDLRAFHEAGIEVEFAPSQSNSAGESNIIDHLSSFF
jgi:hypothetical protein